MSDPHAPNENDHRRIGRSLGLFATDELLGSGLPMWLPAGSAVRAELERFVVELERRTGYRHVHTPSLGKRELYERSGHLGHFGDDMFPLMSLGGEEFVLRPMNCPHHMRVFGASDHSYRDLPYRVAELGAMFRAERSGVLGGLSRVRAMTLNDGHVFCSRDQAASEVAHVLALIHEAHEVLGVDVHRFRLSLRGDGGKYVDDADAWAFAEGVLRGALRNAGVAYEEEGGEAAFYGPKIDVQVVDAGGRELTLSTVQLDLHLPGRFGLSYTDAGGADAVPVVVHRSLVGTFERLAAYLVERYAGAFPVWLAPVQLAILPVADDWDAEARSLAAHAVQAGLRCEVVDARHSVAARVRDAVLAKVPYVAVLGERDVRAGTVSVRRRGEQRNYDHEQGALVAAIAAEAESRAR
ncbi:MAG TPA: threonine--tRNA ligase [Acidimicrobiales bacterium]